MLALKRRPTHDSLRAVYIHLEFIALELLDPVSTEGCCSQSLPRLGFLTYTHPCLTVLHLHPQVFGLACRASGGPGFGSLNFRECLGCPSLRDSLAALVAALERNYMNKYDLML